MDAHAMNANKQVWSLGTMRPTALNTYSDATLKRVVVNVDLSGVFDAVNVKTYVHKDKPKLGRQVGVLVQEAERLQHKLMSAIVIVIYIIYVYICIHMMMCMYIHAHTCV